jgi:hypothetical protein
LRGRSQNRPWDDCSGRLDQTALDWRGKRRVVDQALTAPEERAERAPGSRVNFDSRECRLRQGEILVEPGCAARKVVADQKRGVRGALSIQAEEAVNGPAGLEGTTRLQALRPNLALTCPAPNALDEPEREPVAERITA